MGNSISTESVVNDVLLLLEASEACGVYVHWALHREGDGL